MDIAAKGTEATHHMLQFPPSVCHTRGSSSLLFYSLNLCFYSFASYLAVNISNKRIGYDRLLIHIDLLLCTHKRYRVCDMKKFFKLSKTWCCSVCVCYNNSYRIHKLQAFQIYFVYICSCFVHIRNSGVSKYVAGICWCWIPCYYMTEGLNTARPRGKDLQLTLVIISSLMMTAFNHLWVPLGPDHFWKSELLVSQRQVSKGF